MKPLAINKKILNRVDRDSHSLRLRRTAFGVRKKVNVIWTGDSYGEEQSGGQLSDAVRNATS